MKEHRLITAASELGEVRFITRNNEPLFVAKDVCEQLGIKNSRDSVAKILAEDERESAIIYTPGGPQTTTVVTESGLYHLIFQSRKPKAQAFRKWVTSEVLPQIRRTGYYISPNAVLPRREKNALRRRFFKELNQNISPADVYACSRRLRYSEDAVNSVLRGTYDNNEIMLDLQQRAEHNRENRIDAYSDARLQEMVEKLQ